MDSLAVMTAAPSPWPLAPFPAGEEGAGFASLVEQNQGAAMPSPLAHPVDPPPGAVLAGPALPGLPAMPPGLASMDALEPEPPPGETPGCEYRTDAGPAVVARVPSGLRASVAPAPPAARPPASPGVIPAPADPPEAASDAGEAPSRWPERPASPPVSPRAPFQAVPLQVGGESLAIPGVPPIEVPAEEVARAPVMASPMGGHRAAPPLSSPEDREPPDTLLALDPSAAVNAQLGFPGTGPAPEATTPSPLSAPTERGASALQGATLLTGAAAMAWPPATAAPVDPEAPETPLPSAADEVPAERPAAPAATAPAATAPARGAEAPRLQREAPPALAAADAMAFFNVAPGAVEGGSLAAPRAEGPSPPPPLPPARQVATLAIALAFAPGQFSVALDPPQLGRVEIAVQREGDGHQVRILAERPETLALLERDRGELDRALADAGVALGEGGLTFALAGDAGGSGDAQAGREHEAGRLPRHVAAGQPPSPGPSPPPTTVRGLLDLRI